MPKKRQPVSLVIDASVARASGNDSATFPLAIYCRDYLSEIINHEYKVVFSPEMSREWNKHQSNFALGWRTSMVARRRIEVLTEDPANMDFRNAISSSQSTPNQKRAMLKDSHLVECAGATDNRVSALDDTVRRLFQYTTGVSAHVKKLVWVNPGKIEETPLQWLRDGAKAETARMLR